MSSVEDRLDRVEQKLGELTNILATMTDALDARLGRFDDLDERVEALGQLAEVASQPDTISALTEVVRKAPLLADSVAKLAEVESLLATAVDATDGLVAKLDSDTTTMHDRLRSLATLADRASQPRTLQALATMVDQAPSIAPLGEQLGQLNNLAATAMDGIDGLMQTLDDADESVSNHDRIMGVLRWATLATNPKTMAPLLSMLQVVTEEMSQPQKMTAPMGLMALWRASKEEDVQRTLQFSLRIASAFGRELKKTQQQKALTKRNGQ